MPFITLSGLGRFLTNVRALINAKAAEISPAPWKFTYNEAGDILGMERDLTAYTATRKDLPYKVTASVALTDESKAYNDTDNTEYAVMPTGTDERTAKILIDTQIPQGSTISSMTISFKVGSDNISPSIWTKRTYSVKCGSNVLGNGTLTLRTAGYVATISVTDTSKIISPIIEIDITAQTTEEKNIRIFGAQVESTYTATREWVTVMRQNQLAK
jgi:hypothetical protein